jgi:hypothetical protein
MHVHQKSNPGRHPEAEQTSLCGLSQYPPSNEFSVITQLQENYNFLSATPASRALGWRACASSFNHEPAQKYLAIHQRIRPLLPEPWYPFTDRNQGLIIAYRHAGGACRVSDVREKANRGRDRVAKRIRLNNHKKTGC